ncbi:MAG TPA: alpha-glucosidase/alpha-galactosidase [Chloroflexota bacterium]|nr:alpha-glucosidase/alpha-galactosidase [Chloroflexota bacterium]
MAKIAIIGAGGYVFPLRLVGDLLSFPALRDSTFALMDLDLGRAERTAAAARELTAHHGFPARIETTTDRRAALDGARYVIVTFQVGGIDAYRQDVEIPRRYGVDQTVGDTLGPGGVFRFLRSAPAYRAIAADMRELCPDALLINYANPMAMNCWLLSRLGVATVGLCHSVQGTSRMLARHLEVPYDEVRYVAAGINHQAWFLDFKRGDEDLYPRLREVMQRQHLPRRSLYGLAADRGEHSDADRGVSVYEGGQERVRTEIMAAFGYFHTESSHHASEYLPYFRKNPETVSQFIQQRWDYYEICAAHDESGRNSELLGQLKAELKPSVEYGALIVDSVETNTPRVIYGNVANRNLIPNLPAGCCVEVPCLVDGNGIQPTAVGPLPPQCAAVNRTNVNVQELAVEAVLAENREHIYHAVSLDPLTGALLTLEQIHALVDELIEAEREWLPGFVT